VSLAFADNASNGIEPPFSWTYLRRKREADGSTTEYTVQDHAWRLYESLGGDVTQLPAYFVSALQMSPASHIAMMQAVQPFVDTAISKTVNVPADCPYDDFKGLYLLAWQAGAQGPGHLPAQHHPGLGAGDGHTSRQRRARCGCNARPHAGRD
jgi:ribonucleoside-diphosphate reductase alpha chain